MVTYTTTYNLKKPTVADDEDVWGGYLNDSMDLIDDVLDGTTPVTGIDINSGTIDNVVVGGTTAVAGTFTVLTANTSLGVTGNITVSGTVDGRDVAADGTKLDGVESGATADQTNAEIRAAVEAATDSNVFTDADHTKLNGIAAGATNVTNNNQLTNGAGYTTNVGDITGVTAGSGISGGGTSGTVTVSHADTSSQSSANNSGATVIQDVTLDTYGHVTGLGSHTLTLANLGYTGATNANYITNNNQLTNGAGYTTYTANQSLNTSNSPSFAGLNINGTLNAVDHIYLAGTLFHEGDTNTYLTFTTDTITLATAGSSEVTVNSTGVRLGDSGNGYFQPVSGSYGSIQIDGGAHSGWEGYSIGGRVVFMHDNSSGAGLYNDVNNEWLVNCALNGAVNLYYDGASKLDTLSNGVSINGNLYTDGSNAEDYDALSGTSVTCNVDNAGAFSLTMTGNTTFTFSGADSNWSMGFILQLTGNGSTVTWPSSVDWAGGTAPDAPASGETDILVFWTRDGGTTWYGVQSIDAAA